MIFYFRLWMLVFLLISFGWSLLLTEEWVSGPLIGVKTSVNLLIGSHSLPQPMELTSKEKIWIRYVMITLEINILCINLWEFINNFPYIWKETHSEFSLQNVWKHFYFLSTIYAKVEFECMLCGRGGGTE